MKDDLHGDGMSGKEQHHPPFGRRHFDTIFDPTFGLVSKPFITIQFPLGAFFKQIFHKHW